MFDSVGGSYPTDREVATATYGTHDCHPQVWEHSPTKACDPDESQGIVFTAGALFEACTACDNGFGPLSDCRPLVCSTDDDCPLYRTLEDGETVWRDYTCELGLCSRDDLPLVVDGTVERRLASSLCAAPMARGDFNDDVPDDYCPGGERDDPCPLPLPASCIQL